MIKNIKSEKDSDLLTQFEYELKRDHYNSLNAPSKSLYSIIELRSEILRRLRKASAGKLC